MKSLVIVHSYHHKNTEKIANVIAENLKADLKYPKDVNINEMLNYDIVGFGAGIDTGKHYKPMLELAKSIQVVNSGKAFIFSTSGIWTKKKQVKDHKALRDILISKGYDIIGEFGCLGHDTVSFLKYFGGINKGRPNGEDLENARQFALTLNI